MKKLVFHASHQLSAEWPILLIDFDTMNLVDEEEVDLALKVLNHLSEPALTQPIYHTCQGEPIAETSNYFPLPDWTLEEGRLFLEALIQQFPNGGKLQLCGMYRELCLLSVANLMLRHTNLEPIIIDHDDYSISAVYSVAEGETLDYRVQECGGILTYLT